MIQAPRKSTHRKCACVWSKLTLNTSVRSDKTTGHNSLLHVMSHRRQFPAVTTTWFQPTGRSPVVASLALYTVNYGELVRACSMSFHCYTEDTYSVKHLKIRSLLLLLSANLINPVPALWTDSRVRACPEQPLCSLS